VGQGSAGDAEPVAHGIEIGLERLVAPHEVDEQSAVVIIDEFVLGHEMTVVVREAGRGQMLEEPSLEAHAHRISSVLVFRDHPVPRVAHERELEVGLELPLAQVAAGDVFGGLEVCETRRPLGRIVIGAEEQRLARIPGQAHQAKERVLDADAAGLGDVDEHAAVRVTDHAVTARSPAKLPTWGANPG
jgi:hypothetical protein